MPPVVTSHLNRRSQVLLHAALLLALILTPMLAAFAAGPTPVTNSGLTLPQGTTAPITSSQLQTTNDTTTPDQIFYHLDNVPAHGSLLLNGTPLSAGTPFTQADINANHVSYAHNGSVTTSDSFGYAVWSTTRASVAANGAEADSNVYCPHLSSDGRFVSFQSDATNLVNGDTNAHIDVFVRDRQNNTITRVSVASNGAQALNGDSECSSISDNGRYVAFESTATNLVSGDTNNVTDIFVRDLQNNTTTRVSVSSSGTQANKASSSASISANGNFVAFESEATNLVSGDSGGFTDVFVHEMLTGKTILVSLRSDGFQTNENSYDPSISADGQVIAFGSWAGDLTNLPGDNYTGYNFYVRNVRTNTTVRASIASDNAPGTGGEAAGIPTISSNGRYVAFASQADDLVSGDTNNVNDLFIHDLQTGQTIRVSVDSNGAQAVGGNSSEAALSADGRFVAFSSAATNLDPRCASGGVFLHDTITAKTICVSVASSGAVSNNSSDSPALSSDGRYVAFRSDATNLVNGDNNSKCDIFVYDSGFSASFAVSITPVAGTTPAPTVAPIANQTILENTSTGALAFAVNAANISPDALIVDATSSNPDLVPPTGIVLGGSGANRTITVTPAQTNAANPATVKRQGTATITVRVSDGTNTSSMSFLLTVNPPPWLALLYLNGDDAPSSRSLSEPVRDLLQRLRYAMPYNPNVRLVVLYDGNESVPNGGYGDSRVYVRDPNDLTDVTIGLAAPNSAWPNFPTNLEMNTGNTSTVSTFMRWARATYPTAHTFLSMIDHGGGWAPDLPPAQPRKGQWGAGGWRGMSVDYTSDYASLSTRNLREALRDGLDPSQHLDVVFLDACLMGMTEVAYELHDYADYMVAGENLLYATLPYERYLAADSLGSTTAPQELASHIVDRYNSNDPEQNPFTIAAIDLSKLRGTGPNNLPTVVNTLADRMLAALPAAPVSLDDPVRAAFTAAYNATQKFDYDSSLTIDPTDGYVDLADFARNLRDSPSPRIPTDIRAAASAVFNTIVQFGSDQVVITKRTLSNTYENHFWDLSGSNGLSIFLPLGEEDYRPTLPDPNNLNNALPERQLTYYINPNQLQWAAATPQWSALLLRLEANTPIRAPGGLSASLAADPGTIDQRPFSTPYLLPIPKLIYLPIVMR